MVVEQGGGSTHALMGEMCHSYLCGSLCSHGNNLSSLLFLKSTAWDSIILKSKKMMLTSLKTSQVNTTSSTRLSYYLGNAQLSIDW